MAVYDNIVSIAARGTAETSFTSVAFKATVTKVADTGPKAKAAAAEPIEKILNVVREHAEKGGIDTNKLNTWFDVNTNHDRNTGSFRGYKAVYTIKFKAKNVAHATTIHDALTSIDGVEASSPQFKIDDSADVYARAFKDAVEKARVKFADQCNALDLAQANFRLTNWHISEEEPSGKFLSLRSGDDTAHVKPGIEPGKANYELRVTFAYVRAQ